MSPDKQNGQSMIFHQFWNSFWLLLLDCMIFISGLMLGNLIVYQLHGIPVSLQYSLLLLPAWCAGAVVTGQVPGWGLGSIEELRRIQLLLLALFAFAGIAAFLIGGMTSRIVYLFTYALSAVLIPFGRVLCKKVLAGSNRWGCPVVVYGDQEAVSQIVRVLNDENSIGYNPIGIFSDNMDDHALSGVPLLGALSDASRSVPVAIASLSHFRERDLVDFIDHTLADYHKVVLLPDISEGVFAWVVPRDFNGVVGLELSRNLLNPLAAGAKWIYEIGLVLLFLPLWLPLILLVALLVFLGDFRNPFYRQTRVGKNGRLFKAIKLRTMVPNADEALQKMLDENAGLKEEWETFYKLKSDPRITLIGRFLRRFSLDELPQLFNVLSSEMALVGPRPLPVYHQDELPEKSRIIRDQVRPGMTGQWQVSGRSDCGIEEMEQLDNFYVRNWSVWMDIYIIFRTLRVVFFSHGAY